jgi:DNA polymerase-3 subunit gamma/tau
MEGILAQDLSATMLLYDDIDRKGFEGDLVLNGMAEFMRNLLICKDEKTAPLLEVVEGFEEKYISTAKKVSHAFLLSALNVLNEAEINYKAARNKRLHVELALIKLTYLEQALELVNETASVSKKKPAETARPVAYRKITPIEFKTVHSQNGAAIESVKTGGRAGNKMGNGAKLEIETGTPEAPESTESGKAQTSPDTSRTRPTAQVAAPVNSTLGTLVRIRKQVQQSRQNGNEEIRTLNQENLAQAWSIYVDQLLLQKNHSAANNFKMAHLKVVDPNYFEIITENNIQQKFIEQERGPLAEHLQRFFNNRTLSYQILVEESPGKEDKDQKPLTQMEQYQQIIESYPLVKELKDRLKLDLEF